MHFPTPTLKAGLLLFAICCSSTLGCKDKAKCDEALKTARQAMQDEYLDMDLARKWRDHAGKICGQPDVIATLDKEIIDREAALVKAVEDAAKKAADDGKTALDKAQKVWKAWDKLEEEKQTPASLKKASKKAKKLSVGLLPEYAKQVDDYNKKQNKTRAKKLKDKEKK